MANATSGLARINAKRLVDIVSDDFLLSPFNIFRVNVFRVLEIFPGLRKQLF